MAFTLISPAFDDGEDIPVRHTCDGENTSPELRWTDPPIGTTAYALIVDDPDAPSGLWTHWIVVDIPATAGGLPEGAAPGHAGVDGVNSFRHTGYGGPCPPRGHGVHRYFFRLHALKDLLRLDGAPTRAQVDARVSSLSIGQATLMGRYARR